MSNTRLIFFVKIPGQVEPIPLDIIDSRPTNLVLKDILIITGLASQEITANNYLLSLHGNELDLHLRLSENGVTNGSVLNISVLKDQTKNAEAQIRGKNNDTQEDHHIIEDKPKEKKKTPKNNTGQTLPGKLIDFD